MPTVFWKSILKCFPSAPTCLAPLAHGDQENDSVSPPKLNHSKHLSTVFSSTNASTSSSSDSDSCRMDLTAIAASNRFFFSSPGRSNSIIESVDTPPPPVKASLNGGVPVKKYSADPREDFRRSMLEMIEARLRKSDIGVVDCDYLHELLSCYLTLNPENTHRFILRAFADIMLSLTPAAATPETSVEDSDAAAFIPSELW